MQRLAQISRASGGARTSAVSRASRHASFSPRTTASYTSPAKTEADTTARSPGTGDPKMSCMRINKQKEQIHLNETVSSRTCHRDASPIGRCCIRSKGKQAMTKLIAGLALLFLIGGGGTDARAAGSWCAFYDASTYNCGFHSFEQCRETVLGAGGWCRPNFFEDRPGGQRNRAR